MKTLALAVTGLLALASARGEPPVPSRVRAECDMIVVPLKEALALTADLEDDAKIDDAWQRLQQMIQTGAATQVAHLMGHSGIGQRIEVATIEEFRYSSDFEPPEFLKSQLAARAKPAKTSEAT